MTNAYEILKIQEKKVADLEQQLSMEKSRLEGMRLMAEQLSGETHNEADEKPAGKRRMRLGSKKRVIYHLIGNGFETVASLSRHLHNSVIDARYVRDVVRDGLADDDLHGDLDDKFILSDLGKQLLEKANLPKDWNEFEHLTNLFMRTNADDPNIGVVTNKAPDTVAKEASQVTEDVSPSSNESVGYLHGVHTIER